MTLKQFFLTRQFIGYEKKLHFSSLKKLHHFLENKKTLADIGFSNIPRIQNLLKYDSNIDFEKRLKLIQTFKRDGISLSALTARYGEKEAKIRQKKTIEKIVAKTSKQGYISKFGEIEGLKRYKKARGSVSESIMIERYGEKEGKEKWQKYLIKWKFANSLDGYIFKYGKENGKEKWKNRYQNGNKIDVHIKKHGKEKGTEIFETKMKKMWLSTSKQHFLKIHGEEKGEELFRKLKDNISLKSKIEKYGEEKGTKIYNAYIENLKQRAKDLNFAARFNSAQWYSKVSQELFWKILDLNDLQDDEIYFAEHNGEWFIYDNERKNISKFDFKYKNKIIEFNGDYWHRNPKIYTQDVEITQRDNYKHNLVKNNNFELLIIWENDYYLKQKETLNICIEFLKT